MSAAAAPQGANGADIVALGEAMIEFNQARADDPRTYLQGFGGDTSNMAIAAARVGARAGYVTHVGDDAFGRMLLALWKEEGVSTAGVATDAAAPTGVYFVTHGPQGHEFSYLRAGSAASRMTPATLPRALIRGAKILHVSGISQAISATACDASLAAMDEARAAGVRVSYDTNLRLKLWPLPRARAVILTSLARCDFCVPSQIVKSRLEPSDPTIAPRVLAAYTPPTSRAGSSSREATDASASGKLAPQRIEGGSTANSTRVRSS